MKRIVLFTAGLLAIAAAQPASAADVARRPPPPAPAPAPVPVAVYNWTGFYIGAHGGYGWADKGWTDTTTGPFSISHNADGFLAGGQIGFNYQINNIVFGIEGDLSWADITGGTSSGRFGGETFDTRIDWLGTLTGRVGFAFNNWLIYGKGGFAWANERLSYTAALPAFAGSSEETRTGWTVGAGIEYGFWNNWSAKLEYNYMDFGSRDVAYAPGIGFDVDQQVHAVKLGLNYRFGGGPIAARY
jgi:outer membrane immunogenic protein